MSLRFTKMHGAGNDFVVLDLRNDRTLPERAELVRMADRHFGIGCDQIMVLEPPRQPVSLAAYRIINTDGSPARQCGNGARCLAAWLHRTGELTDTAVLDSPSGPVPVRVLDDGSIEVTLGVPVFDPPAIPMREVAADPSGYRLDLDDGAVRFGALSMGNPHAVIEVDDLATAPVERATALQHHRSFPDSCNVGFVRVLGRDHIGLRVVERGVGETLACGSAACAAHAWLRRAGKVDECTRIDLPGGTLTVSWTGADREPVRMRGPTAFTFEGTWPT